jgi:uncharacterized protein YqgC (DUF456 family)
MTKGIEQILETAILVTELSALSASYTALYLTFLFGYLIVAYIQGKQLRRSQAAIITALFVFWSLINTYASFFAMNSAYYFAHTYGAGRLPEWGALAVATLQGLGALAALKFMWDVRHPKE